MFGKSITYLDDAIFKITGKFGYLVSDLNLNLNDQSLLLKFKEMN